VFDYAKFTQDIQKPGVILLDEIDRALVGRFFQLDYIPHDCEVKVLSKRCGINAADAENIANVAGTVRSLYGKQEISCTISTRETLAAARLVADGWTSLEAMELTFLPLFEGTRAEGERSRCEDIHE
jgi:hypothetical protein